MGWLMAGSHDLVHWVASQHYLALFVLILVEEAGCPLPLPGESLILFAGSRIARGEMSVLQVFGAVLPASAIGCTILYYLARTFGRRLIARFGPHVHLDEAKLAKFEAKARRLGPAAVLLGRLTPGLRVPTDAAAGLFRIPYRYYLPFALLATCLRLAFFLYVGATAQRVGQAMQIISHAKFATGAVILALVLGGLYGWRHFWPRRVRPEPARLELGA